MLCWHLRDSMSIAALPPRCRPNSLLQRLVETLPSEPSSATALQLWDNIPCTHDS